LRCTNTVNNPSRECMSKSRLCVVFLAALCVNTAMAAVITLRTGVDGSLNPLADGSSDPFWQVSVQGGAFTAAKVSFVPDQVDFGMETVTSEAKWITDPSVVDGSVNTGWGVSQLAIARRTFDLTGFNLSTTSLSGIWRLADDTAGLFLNGTLIPGTSVGTTWAVNTAVNVPAGSALFVSGINTLELRGTSRNSQWDGFWFSGTVSGDTAVPEPGSAFLIVPALAGIVFALRRR
jgi:hypothetical protein